MLTNPVSDYVKSALSAHDEAVSSAAKPVADAKSHAEQKITEMCEAVGANGPEAEEIKRFVSTILFGAKFIDLHVRVDGQEYRFEADWLARFFRRHIT